MQTRTIRIWDDDSKKPRNAWWSKDINSINTVIKANLPQSYVIRKALLKVYADFDGAGGLANVYMKYGFGGNGSISTQLGGEHKITKDETPYPSSGIDIVSYLSGGNQEISKNYGEYLSVNIYTSNIVVTALRMGHAELTITYEVWYNSSVVASPQNGGSVSCLGGAWENSNDHLIATPNPGYKFIGWYRDGVMLSSESDVYLSIPYDDTVFTAVFEKLTYDISTSVSPTESGVVTGGGVYEYGSAPTLTAIPNAGYKFVKWNDDVTQNPRTIAVSESVVYTAYFEKTPPKFTSAEMTYCGKQVSEQNKVISGQGFIISAVVI